jgi:hypothetical protein
MFDKLVFGLLVLLIGSGMGLGIGKDIKHQAENPSVSLNQIQSIGNMKWDTTSEDKQSSGTHLSMDEIRKVGEEFVKQYKTDVELIRIIETSKYFYIVFQEKTTGTGAFELLADPITGKMGFETGPSQLWNTKYGMWGSGSSMINGIPLNQALNNAAQFSKKEDPSTSVSPDPISFNGYYSFLTFQNGKINGVVSVNGFTGEVQPHSWLGKVLQSREYTKSIS